MLRELLVSAILLGSAIAAPALAEGRGSDSRHQSRSFPAARLHQVDRALEEAVAKGLLPGAVVLIARDGEIVHHEAVGTLDAAAAAMPKDAIFRIGSMTKPVVTAAAKSADVPVIDSVVRVPVEDPKGILQELNTSDLADRECFEGTMARIETDLDNMRARANAWAVGDIEGLAALPHENHYSACQQALTGSVLAQRLGLDDLPERAQQAWLENVEEAIEQHQVSFTMLSMHQLLGEGGMLERLAARGYTVESP